MINMKKSEFTKTINATKEKVWQVLFDQYGDIQVHNPTMKSSYYMGNAKKGELNCVRHCQFDDKLYVEEKITGFIQNKSFNVQVNKHNLPFVKEMSASYELTAISDEITGLKMTSFVSTSPAFMVYLMKGQMGKSLNKHLFGLKYFIETGKTVEKHNYTTIFSNYQSRIQE